MPSHPPASRCRRSSLTPVSRCRPSPTPTMTGYLSHRPLSAQSGPSIARAAFYCITPSLSTTAPPPAAAPPRLRLRTMPVDEAPLAPVFADPARMQYTARPCNLPQTRHRCQHHRGMITAMPRRRPTSALKTPHSLQCPPPATVLQKNAYK
ncbi:hypothetical protein ACLOJK_038651 [Asimina triloba]